MYEKWVNLKLWHELNVYAHHLCLGDDDKREYTIYKKNETET